MYQKEKRELLATGNRARVATIDSQLWEILNDAFGSRPGINGNVLMDTDLAEDDDGGVDSDGDATESNDAQSTSSKVPPIAQLATALQTGMQAIALSLSSRPVRDSSLDALASLLQTQHEENSRAQAVQVQLLQQLLRSLESRQ